MPGLSRTQRSLRCRQLAVGCIADCQSANATNGSNPTQKFRASTAAPPKYRLHPRPPPGPNQGHPPPPQTTINLIGYCICNKSHPTTCLKGWIGSDLPGHTLTYLDIPGLSRTQTASPPGNAVLPRRPNTVFATQPPGLPQLQGSAISVAPAPQYIPQPRQERIIRPIQVHRSNDSVGFRQLGPLALFAQSPGPTHLSAVASELLTCSGIEVNPLGDR